MGFASGDCDAANPVRQRQFFVSTQYKDDSDILDYCSLAIANIRFSS